MSNSQSFLVEEEKFQAIVELTSLLCGRTLSQNEVEKIVSIVWEKGTLAHWKDLLDLAHGDLGWKTEALKYSWGLVTNFADIPEC